MPGRIRSSAATLAGHADADRDALHHLGEVAGGVVGRQQAEDRAGRRRDAQHRPFDIAVGIGVDGDLRRLAGLQVLKLRLLEVRVDVDVLQRHQRHQPRAGLNVFAGLRRAVADDAVEGRAHDRVVEVEPAPCRRRACPGRERAPASAFCAKSTAAFASAVVTPAFAASTPAFACSNAAFADIDRLLRPDRLAGERHGPVVFELGVRRARLRGSKLGLRLRRPARCPRRSADRCARSRPAARRPAPRPAEARCDSRNRRSTRSGVPAVTRELSSTGTDLT